ncbi:MAG: hypothetical protein D6677_04140 [Calditrichaeota bacterium]|nr:MAG: hypothetical protein D6677_04140 [Calditrichota bacterium]
MSIYRFMIVAAVAALAWSCQQGDTINSADAPDARFGRSADRVDTHGLYMLYDITIENMTPATAPGASQPMSPAVVASHNLHTAVFKTGRLASDELAQLAEDAVSAPLVESLNDNPLVYDVQQGDGVIFPGASTTIRIKARPGFQKLSIVSMLVNTNDAFMGVDGLLMPLKGSKTVYAYAYDAGSEKNTESMDHIPGPCCGSPHVRVPTSEPIHLHGGIQGVGDLDPAIYGWDGPAARITVTRVQ